MRPMEHPDLAKQKHPDAGAFTFADLRAQLDEQRLDVAPWNRSTDRAGKEAFQRLAVLLLYG